ncbi:glycosyltransferase family 2 protein [Pectobacterium polaris]|uniref:glycosyltransferase family 2 protein n=1 Tax=Pectobacterium polaris TaxID=2042057 RepID=UPI000BB352E3|nr:glycosyltransferase family 2 protein [Pectobacterium polaris]ASY76561.1 glycosyl transferase [Pectobacterium polaris]
MKKISIILVSYNSCELTLQTIKSIYEKTQGITFEVILVDNNSIDDTLVQVEKLFPKVICIKNNENKGFGSANNLGAKRASGDYLFLLNTDTLLISNAVKILSDYLDLPENKNVVAVGGNLVDINHRPMTSHSKLFPGVLFEINELFFNFLHKIKIFNYFFNFSGKAIQFRGSVSGADCMIRKKQFDEINGFDEDYFLYYEETDLFYRLTRYNYLVANVPNAKIIHLEGGSEKNKERTLERSFASKNIYMSKHKSSLIIHIIRFLSVLKSSSRIILFSLVKEKKEYWQAIKKIENKVYSENRHLK